MGYNTCFFTYIVYILQVVRCVSGLMRLIKPYYVWTVISPSICPNSHPFLRIKITIKKENSDSSSRIISFIIWTTTYSTLIHLNMCDSFLKCKYKKWDGRNQSNILYIKTRLMWLSQMQTIVLIDVFVYQWNERDYWQNITSVHGHIISVIYNVCAHKVFNARNKNFKSYTKYTYYLK